MRYYIDMVKIRLARGGAKNAPFYRVVITDSRNARDGKFIERIGFFNPMNFKDKNRNILCIQLERFQYWLSKGARPSVKVRTLVNTMIKKSIQ